MTKHSRVPKHQNAKKQFLKVKKIPSEKPNKIIEPKKATIVTEVKFVQSLVNNNANIRHKVLKKLKKWLAIRSHNSAAFMEEDFLRLWKGLFYCMWMSDKPLIQEELAESISTIVHCITSRDAALLYTQCGFKILAQKWSGIDQYRLDKFAMLVRRIIRQTFESCKKNLWNDEWVTGVAKIMEKLLLDGQCALGLCMHVAEIYLEELAKISRGKISPTVVTNLIEPWILHIVPMHDETQIKHVMRHIFRYLVFQSDIGLEYNEKFQVWKQAGFPRGGISEIEKVEISDDEASCNEEVSEDDDGSNQPLDPRAGRVNVELPQLPIDAQEIADLFMKNRFHPSSTAKSRRQIIRLHREFTEVAKGNMPLGMQYFKMPRVEKSDTNCQDAALRLLEYQKELYHDTPKNERKRQKNEASLEMNDEANENNQSVPLKKRKVNVFNKCISSDDSIVAVKNHLKPIELSTKKKNLKCKKLKLLGKKEKKRRKNNLKENDSDLENLTVYSQTKKMKTFSSCRNWNVSDNLPEKIAPHIPSIEMDCNSGNDASKESPFSTKRKQHKKLVSSISTKSFHEKKRVKIALQRNTAQNTSEYIRQIQLSPGIPYDPNRKPTNGVLKMGQIPSPINPFYEKKLK